MKHAITSLAAAAVVATATPALSVVSFEVQQGLRHCMMYERHLTGHQCQMKYNPEYRSRMEERQRRIEEERRRAAEERRRAEEEKRRRAAEARKRADAIESERRSKRAQEWSDYQDRQQRSGGWVDPCRVGGC